MDAPNYVQGLYTVAQRDAIFAKADKYPDASDGLQNQVPTIFPDGSIGWRQIPDGGDGTANANIAVVEPTQYASRDYAVNDLLIYNDQLCRVSAPIAAGGTITPETNVVSTTVAIWAPESFAPLVGKGVNLLDNAYFIGGGTGYGVFPVNQRGNTQYSGTSPAQPAFDRWKVSYTVATLSANGVELVSSGGYGLLQYLSAGRWDLLVGKTVTLSSLVTANSGDLKFYSGSTLQATRTGTGVLSATFVVPGDFPASSKFVGIQGNAMISAVKLELGSRQTLARKVGNDWVLNAPPPNYQQELAKCKAYLFGVNGVAKANACVGIGVGNTTARALVSIEVPMGFDTSLISSGSLVTRGSFRLTPDFVVGHDIPVTSIGFIGGAYNSDTKVLLNVGASAVEVGKWYYLAAANDSNAQILISVEP